MALPITKIKNLFISLKEVKNSIADNVEKLTTVFDNHNTNFEESDCVHNTVTKKILPKKFVNVFLNHDKEGEDCLKEFINDRIQSSISIWKPLKKTKLPKINGNVTYFKTKIDGETTKFNEERNFLSRLIVVARSRPAIDICKYFDDYDY